MASQMQLDWAKDVCVEVFREHGLKLSEDDSIILVAAASLPTRLRIRYRSPQNIN